MSNVSASATSGASPVANTDSGNSIPTNIASTNIAPTNTAPPNTAPPSLVPAKPPSGETLCWLALALTEGLGPSRIRKLVEHFGAADRILQASLTELEATGMRAVSAQSLATGKSLELAQDEVAKAARANATIISLSSAEYPPRLKEIYDPPVILFVKGSIELLSKPGIAMVGTRHPTPYGLGMAERLATDLASRGLVIISGMARGIDTASHRGAIAGKGKTIAVLGTGVDVFYPKENTRLAEQILALSGTIISEFPIGTSPKPQNFPIRNRIISGMSVGVLVVEAAEYSGTRITSRCALEQNRDVYAVPGNVTNKNSWGPNTLIKQGAKLVATWEDVWEDLPADVQAALSAGQNESPAPTNASLFPDDAPSPHEQKLLKLLKPDESTHIDELVEMLENEMSSSEIFCALFELELSGKVRQLPGKNFVKSF
jgi:DNA processing protein